MNYARLYSYDYLLANAKIIRHVKPPWNPRVDVYSASMGRCIGYGSTTKIAIEHLRSLLTDLHLGEVQCV